MDGGLPSGREGEEVCGRGSCRDLRECRWSVSAGLAAQSDIHNTQNRLPSGRASHPERHQVIDVPGLRIQIEVKSTMVVVHKDGRAIL